MTDIVEIPADSDVVQMAVNQSLAARARAPEGLDVMVSDYYRSVNGSGSRVNFLCIMVAVEDKDLKHMPPEYIEKATMLDAASNQEGYEFVLMPLGRVRYWMHEGNLSRQYLLALPLLPVKEGVFPWAEWNRITAYFSASESREYSWK